MVDSVIEILTAVIYGLNWYVELGAQLAVTRTSNNSALPGLLAMVSDSTTPHSFHTQTTIMSEQYYCPICANNFPKAGAEYIASTDNNCRGCLLTLEQAKELVRPIAVDAVSKPTYYIRGSYPFPCAVLTCTDTASQRCRPKLLPHSSSSTSLNFCLSSLDVTSTACPAHMSYDRRAALRGRHSSRPASDTSANTTSQIPRATRNPTSIRACHLRSSPSSYLLFTLTLAAFNVFGACPFTASCLRRTHHANPSLFDMLADDNPMNVQHGPDVLSDQIAVEGPDPSVVEYEQR